MLTLHDYITKFETERLDVFTKAHQTEIYNDLLRFVRTLRPDEDARKIQAVPRIAKKQLSSITASKLGISKRRYENFCSNIRSALNKVELKGSAYQTISELPQAWQDLLNDPCILNSVRDPDSKISKYMRNGLNAFAKEVAGFGIEDPKDIKADLFPAFLTHMEEVSFKKNPRTQLRNKVVAWNNFHQAHSHWPGELITLPGKDQFLIDVVDMHLDLQHEIEAYMAYMKNPLKHGSRERKYRLRDKPYEPVTISLHVDRLRYAAACLVKKGHRLEELKSIKNLVNPDAMNTVSEVYREKKQTKLRKLYEDGISSPEFMEKTSGEHAYLKDLRTICLNCYNPNKKVRFKMAAAVNRTSEADYDLGAETIKTVIKGEGLSLKNQERVDAILEDMSNFKKYLELSRKAMDSVECIRKGNTVLKAEDYYRFQNATGLTLLIGGAMRIGDLAELNMAKSYQSTSNSQKQTAKFIYRTRKSNYKKEMEIILSEIQDNYLRLYLKHYRPFFAKGISTDYLFPGQDPTQAISVNRLAIRISEFVEKAIGVDFHCHLNRHLTGNMMMKADPKNAELTSKILGHANVKTTLEFYVQNQTGAAHDAKDKILKEQSSYALI